MVARLRAQPNVVVLDETEVLAFRGRHHVTGLRVRRADTAAEYDIDVAAVFVAIGQTLRSDLLMGLVDLLIDRRYRQAVTAAATGCQAALDAQRWLSQTRTATTNIIVRKEITPK